MHRLTIDPNKLRFFHFSKNDNFSLLDFRQYDGTDPLHVDKFIREEVSTYLDNHLGSIYSVRYEDELVAFFTLSMSCIGYSTISTSGDSYVETKLFPALLIGKIGIDKAYRGRKIGQYICSFCSGIGQELNRYAACAFLVLRTTASLARRYYAPKFNFEWTAREEGNVWMYRKLF